MATTRKILTLHSSLRPALVEVLLTSIEAALYRAGASHVWIDPCSIHDVTVMAELPEGAMDVDLGLSELPSLEHELSAADALLA